MTATEVSRSFSDVLNRVADGEEIEVTRGGVPVAAILPSRSRLISAARFRDLIASAPCPDPGFAGDVRAACELVGVPGDPWPS